MSKVSAVAADSSHLGAAAVAAGGLNDQEYVSDLVNSAKRSEFLDTLSPKHQETVQYLKELETKYDKLRAKFIIERAALEEKYEELYEALFKERSDIVAGIKEVIGGKAVSVQLDEGDKETEEKGMPNFWLIAMKKNELIGAEIKEQDEEALKYLKDIKYCKLDCIGQGFQLMFTFDPNPFFKNNILTKTYHMIREDGDTLDKVIGSAIEWLPGKYFNDKILTMKSTDKILMTKSKNGSERENCFTKYGNYGSFFNFFNPPKILDAHEAGIKVQLDLDYDIGCTFRDEIIPYAASWYSGEVVDDEYDKESVGRNDEYDDNNEDYDEDSEEEKEENEENEVVLENGSNKKV